MAFANLFKGLSPVVEGVKSPAQPVSTLRNQTDGKRDPDRKRKAQCEQTGHYGKKQLYQAQAARTTLDSFHMHNTGNEHGEVMYSHSHNNMCHKGQNYKPKNNSNVTRKKQEPKKKSEWEKSQHQHKNRGRPACKGGGHQTRPTWRMDGGDRKNVKYTRDFQVKHPRFMTQEFGDQNVLWVDGRPLCRHFIWGKCIKGDECQLEHIECYNDLIKEVCKFYVQGFCSKGERCPYMHKSFPCKFFHRKGKCFQGADCRFSHEPLNDATKQLLDKALKRENDLHELAKKAEQKSSEQPVITDESEVTEAIPDIFKEPLRPNFYKSADINTEKDTLFCQTEEQAVPPHASDAARLPSPRSTILVNEEPVCYSVEAVLGPQLSKPFTSFFRTLRSQESTHLSSSDCTSDSVNQSQVPYSADAVLQSCKENSTFGHSTPPTEQTISYTPKSYFEEIHDPLSSTDTKNKKDLHLLNTRYEEKKSQEKNFKSLSSLQGHTGLASLTYQNLTLASGNHMKQSGNMPQTHKSAQRPLNEVKEELLRLPLDITASCKSEGVLPFGPRLQTSVSRHPTQLKPHFPVRTLDSEASVRPMCPSSDLTESKAAVPAEPVTSSIKSNNSKSNIVSCYFAPEQPIEIHLHSKKTPCSLTLGTKQHYSTETTAVCTSKMAHCGDLAVGCEKPLKRPFHSLSVSPIADTVQPLDDPVTSSSCAQDLIQSSCPVSQSEDCRLNLKPGKSSARSFLSIFAAPLSAAPLPHMQSQPDYSRISSCSDHSVDNLSHSSGIRASNLETPLTHRVRSEEISYRPRCPSLSSNAKIEKDHVVTPICSPVCDSVSEMSTSPPPCGNSSSTTHVHQQQPDISSQKAATANSVLKTLFLCLSPYQQDRKQQDSIQISAPSESENKDESSTDCVKQPQKSQKKDRQKKNLEITQEAEEAVYNINGPYQMQDSHRQSTKKIAAHLREHQPPQISLEGTGVLTFGSPAEPQMRQTGTHNLSFKPLPPLMRHNQSTLKHTSEEGKAATPIKDLFKTLDTAVFHFGR